MKQPPERYDNVFFGENQLQTLMSVNQQSLKHGYLMSKQHCSGVFEALEINGQTAVCVRRRSPCIFAKVTLSSLRHPIEKSEIQ